MLENENPHLKIFNARSNKFKIQTSQFKFHSEAEESWSILESRQFEIMDSPVDDAKKVEAFDYVLNEIERIHPRANIAYCQALERRLKYTPKKDDAALHHISKLAYAHRGDERSDLYKKIIAEAFQKVGAKKGFPNANVAKNYINKQKREILEEDLRYIKDKINDPYYDPVQKLNKVKEALDLLKKESPLGRIQSNESKRDFCEDAIKICREELYDTNTADYYECKAFDFKRRAATAERKWAQRRGLWTDAQEKAFLKEFGSKKER